MLFYQDLKYLIGKIFLKICDLNDASIKVKNIAELKTQLKDLIIDKNKREIMQNNAFNFAQKQIC